MKQRLLLSLICAAIFLAIAIALVNLVPASDFGVVEAASRKVSQGALQAIGSDGQPRAECPLKHTDVKADVSGQLARVTLTQEFHNQFQEKIEAVYVFPLPQSAAVDDMTMIVGDRTIKGKINRREEAQAIYEAAREAGHTASLLDQERPNIFTQSVANIAPGAEVKITISYVEFLNYEDGTYKFVFPMVVGPRYIPGRPIGKRGGGRAPDTNQVPDASRITPRVASKDTRAGHDISIEVKLDTGVPIDGLKSTLHEIDVARPDDHRAVVRLKDQATIPNKDFILKFDVAGKKISDAVMTHRGAQGGFFTLILQPPERVTAADVAPKELVFVLDTSGSMEGFPIEKAKETMKLALDNLYPDDTFNLITFSGDTHILFPQPVHATRENLLRAQRFLASRQGSGGTEMMDAIRAALDSSDKQDHVRIVCFMTDGEVGNDMEIISEVQKHPNARVFAFGIGSSPNRFLLDKMAEHGRGEVEYVTLEDDGSAAARRFHERVRNPLLTDIEIDW
ncbi:MAG TPA: VIT domain-containing protein, partial [Blastocatellia bacterium]|nr:VIT domain-containing protein [Blastocatellia bacterium]